MKLGFTSLVANIPSLACLLIAGLLAYSGREGWGWFLLVAALISKSISMKSERDDDDGDGEKAPTPKPPRDVHSTWRN